MTDWSQLSHAYGSAEDIPALLDRIASEPSSELWNDLWSALCHQGSVYSASFAALPWLTVIAAGDDQQERLNALVLAGAIMAGAGQPHEAGDVRNTYAIEVAALLRMANEHLRTLPDSDEYIYLLEAALALEGIPVWSEVLAWGLVNGGYGVSCPGCETGLFIAIGEYGHFSTSGDYALEDDVEKTSLRPAHPADLEGIGRRLHGVALADGRQDVAATMTYLFGHATCPDCGTDFSVADQVAADG